MSIEQQHEAEGWRPSEGDTIEGKLVDVARGWSDYKDAYYPILTIQAEDGTMTNVHCFHDVLEKRLGDIRPKIGDRLSITYKGKKPTKDGKRTVAVYTVVAPDRKTDTDEFWQGLGAQHPNRDGGPGAAPDAVTPDVPIDDDALPF